MTDEPALLRAVLAAPADDTPRLVYADWLDENGQPERAAFIRQGVERPTWVLDAKNVRLIDGAKLTRGFVSEIRLSLAAFVTYAKAIFDRHPVTAVVLADAVIFPSGGNSTYYVGGLGRFPREYRKSLDGLPSERAARAAISTACVRWGRHMAGLPVIAEPAAVTRS